MTVIILKKITLMLIIFFFFFPIKTELIIGSCAMGQTRFISNPQDEMIKLFKNYKGAIENTLEIDSKIDLKLDSEGFHFPQFPIPRRCSCKKCRGIF